MRIVFFTHSLVSDWNHGNAHFLRGIATEMIRRGDEVGIFESVDNWSRTNLVAEQGEAAIDSFRAAYPALRETLYDERLIDLGSVLRDVDLAIVHEWNSHELVRRIGVHHAQNPNYKLYFHDTHHRAATDPEAVSRYDLSCYDGVLAYGDVIRDLYLRNNWARAAYTWHEAADTNVFKPAETPVDPEGDLVWIGNWGDGERAEELRDFLIEPVRALKLKAKVYGVRYPAEALAELADAGIEYGGWIANYRAPEVFARYRVTVHVPRSPYVMRLRGIPTIRPFEALACGTPLVSAPWNDCERLFRSGEDFLYAHNQEEMTSHLSDILSHPSLAETLSRNGLETLRARHTCAHRVDELMAITRPVQEIARASGGTL